MSALVLQLQQDIRRSRGSVTELLRTAKLISAKLGLSDISEWIKCELEGYTRNEFPPYRFISGGTLQILNPVNGWQTAGHYREPIPTGQPISQLETLSNEKTAVLQPPRHIKVAGAVESMDYMVNQFSQRILISGTQIRGILEAVTEKLLDWSIELEQRGILGENMSFQPEEKASAQNQTFNIQQFTGVLGNVSNSTVQLYNYSSLHQAVKDAGVSKDQRNELEDIMDQLKEAHPSQRASLMGKAKGWLVKNQEVLGATASIVSKALGLNLGG